VPNEREIEPPYLSESPNEKDTSSLLIASSPPKSSLCQHTTSVKSWESSKVTRSVKLVKYFQSGSSHAFGSSLYNYHGHDLLFNLDICFQKIRSLLFALETSFQDGKPSTTDPCPFTSPYACMRRLEAPTSKTRRSLMLTSVTAVIK
jgi:hypothetical protein